MDSVFMTADTLFSQMIFRRDYIARDFKLNREGEPSKKTTRSIMAIKIPFLRILTQPIHYNKQQTVLRKA
ncbi:hypothetical protein KUH03_12885 [Sphingobacterium sp. E70]|uniref:hypothetical protein n=1 Tax=Sphingobacterium sp. E70 TaxID=2853439 RepID=UPI00211C6AE2|nr:hypothetical protein [Sphingobacterium sp. E70]ULT27532.1 hypothetical protein KUH03_12885 [Sphingobacterium sp. E70]